MKNEGDDSGGAARAQAGRQAQGQAQVQVQAQAQAQAQAEPLAGAIPVQTLLMTMEAHLTEMSTGAHHTSVVWNSDALGVPYQAADPYACELIMQDERSLEYVGIARIDELEVGQFLVSDSFGPCVPVILFNDNTVWLAHSDGKGAVNQILRSARMQGADVIIIRKMKESNNFRNANAIAADLVRSRDSKGAPHFNVRIADVPTIDHIAVVVSLVHKRVLVYRSA